MSYLEDPRVYFAAERTLLAWIRTGIAVIALGFVVARFDIFIALMAAHAGQAHQTRGHGILIGVALVALGALGCVFAGLQFTRFLAGLGEIERPRPYLTGCGPWVAHACGAIGLILIGYLLM